MSVSHRYQYLQHPAQEMAATVSAKGFDLEDVRLSAFEAGYQAGWDDAIKSQTDSDQKLTSDFVQNIEDMSFTFHEAYAKLSEGMQPLLAKLMTKLLPEIAQESLGLQIKDQLTKLLDAERATMIEIAVAPENQSVVEELLAGRMVVPFRITSEPALSVGQVYLRSGQVEREINLDAVLNELLAAITAFFETTEPEIEHG